MKGYDYAELTEDRGDSKLDFSVNVNALGIPESVKKYISEAVEVTGLYPDPDCRLLTEQLSDKYQVSENAILCGNGADDLLYRLVFAVKPKKAIIVEPVYEEYNRILELVGCEVCHYSTNPDDRFCLDERILKAIQADCDMLFLCNPNNPSGQLAERPLLEQIVEKCKENNVLLVVDECFMEFIPEWKEYSCKQTAGNEDHLVVIDAFTKIYALAGFRLGFCISNNSQLLARMRTCGADFSVSTLAQFAGICALRDKNYLNKTYTMLEDERKYMMDELGKLPVQVYGSYGNYILIKSDDVDVRYKLCKNGIKVRDCSKFYGLNQCYIRVAVRAHNDNAFFLRVMRDILTSN